MARRPERPEQLDPFAVAFLNRLKDRPEAEQFVLGGYFALKHYLDYRQTADVDAWWKTRLDARALASAREAFAETATEFGYSTRERSWGETVSLEALDGGKKVFSFQVAVRSVEIEPPIPSPWGKIPIETLEENIGAKMTALVNRGAPRDFVDVKAVVDAGLVTTERCWQLWLAKNPDSTPDEGKMAVQSHLASLIARTPLERLAPERQAEARTLRAWYEHDFARGRGEQENETPGDDRHGP